MRRATPLIAGVAVVAALVAAFLVLQDRRASRATVAKVSDAASRAPEGARWVTVGGREFRVTRSGGGGGELVVAESADTDNVNDVAATPQPIGDDVVITWQRRPDGALVARFVDRDGHHVIVTGRPSSEAVRRAIVRRAVVAG